MHCAIVLRRTYCVLVCLSRLEDKAIYFFRSYDFLGRSETAKKLPNMVMLIPFE